MRAGRDHEVLADALSSRLASALIDSARPGKTADVRLYESYRAVPWSDVISGSSTIDITVHFLDRWISENSATLRSHFDRGGSVRIVLPDPDDEELIRSIKSRFPELDQDRIRGSIRDTKARLSDLIGKSTHGNSRAEFHFSRKLTWYCGVRCDHRTLVLSFYEHARIFLSESPSFCIDLRQYPAVDEWFDGEFCNLLEGAVALHDGPDMRPGRYPCRIAVSYRHLKETACG